MNIFKRIYLSFQARVVRPYMTKHYEKTKYGRKLKKLKDIHKGERCFVIGNGPSLRAEDLQKLYEAGIVTFATNRVFKIFENTDWRPTYYVSEDADVLRGIQKEASSVPAKERFIPINLKWYDDIKIDNATYFYMDYKSEFKDSNGLSLDVSHGIRCRGTVTVTCIQLAVYMGFDEIYLIGVDHSYSKVVNSKGEIIEDKTVKDYFSDSYDTDFKNSVLRNLDATTKSYSDVKTLSDTKGTFRVYNATRGGKLKVFETVDFDSLF